MAMIDVDVRVGGMREIEAALRRFPADLEKKALTAGLRAGGAILVKEAKQQAPKTGQWDDKIAAVKALQKGIRGDKSGEAKTARKWLRSRLKGLRRKGLASSIEYVTERTGGRRWHGIEGTVTCFAPHAHLVEFGTVERVQKTTGRRTGRMPSKPFMRNAYMAKRQAAFQAVLAKIQAYMRKKVL